MYNALFGQLHFAPLDRPSIALDLYCGSGTWLMDMARQYPSTHWYGIDIDISSCSLSIKPQNTYFYNGTLINGRLDYPDGHFDYIHARGILAHLTRLDKRLWGSVLSDVVRLTKPGGWIELFQVSGVVEGCMGRPTTSSSSIVDQCMALDDEMDVYPCTVRLKGVIRRLLKFMNMDMDDYVECVNGLKIMGCAGMRSKWHIIPVGKSLDHMRIGELVCEHMYQVYLGYTELVPQVGVTELEYLCLLEEWRREMREMGGQMRVLVVCAIKSV